MSRDQLSLTIQDLSQFTRALSRQMPDAPSHLALMNMLARAGGYSNLQALRAARPPESVSAATPDAQMPEEVLSPALKRRLARALKRFDGGGQMTGWPGQTSVQALCIWAIWAAMPPKAVMTERQISARIDALTLFRDAAQIRRGMVELRLVERDLAGSAYRRLTAKPDACERTMIEEINRRRQAARAEGAA